MIDAFLSALHRDAAADVVVRVRVTPGAALTRVQVDPCPEGGARLRIFVTAPPADGAANKAALAALATWLRLPTSALTLVRGATAREKTIRIAAAARKPPQRWGR